MSFGYSVFLFFSHISLTACSDFNPTLLHYRVVDGEDFMMPCEKWSRLSSHNSTQVDAQFKAEHSGRYNCFKSGGWWFLDLQVINKSTGCFDAEGNRVMLFIGEGGHITCPGHNCSNSAIEWYKKSEPVSKSKRPLSFSDGQLHLHRVGSSDNDIFFCDREMMEQGVNWTLRRSVIVKAICKYNFMFKCYNKTETQNT